MRKMLFMAFLAALALVPARTFAAGPGVDEFGFRRKLAARAGPWFLYWPYEAYWGTPAPTGYFGASPAPMTLPPGFGYGGYGTPYGPYTPAYYPAGSFPVYGGTNGFGQ